MTTPSDRARATHAGIAGRPRRRAGGAIPAGLKGDELRAMLDADCQAFIRAGGKVAVLPNPGSNGKVDGKARRRQRQREAGIRFRAARPGYDTEATRRRRAAARETQPKNGA